jgi:hypothetical protein
MGWKSVYSRLKQKAQSSSPPPPGVAASPPIGPERGQPTDGTAAVSGLLNPPAISVLGPEVAMQESSGVQQQNTHPTTSAFMISTNTVSAITIPEIAPHVPEKIKDNINNTSISPAPRKSRLGRAGRIAYNAATQLLPIAQTAAEAVPVAGPPLKAVIGGLLKVLNALDVGACFHHLHPCSNRIVLTASATKQDKRQDSD